MGLGLLCVKFHHPPPLHVFLPGAANLFAMTFCFTGITTFVSSWNRDRWRTISIAGGFFVLSLILKFVARMWSGGAWLGDLSFLTLFRPQEMILLPAADGWAGYRSNGILLLLGLAAYALAAVILWRRDIPTPLY
jgi:ABC-2 type transport system permease protein